MKYESLARELRCIDCGAGYPLSYRLECASCRGLLELRYDADRLLLSVQDDGSGFDTENIIPLGVGHYGLTGMRERAERIGGRLTLKSQLGQGTHLLVEVPL